VEEWSKCWNIKINEEKTQAIYKAYFIRMQWAGRHTGWASDITFIKNCSVSCNHMDMMP
jgi:hypothetical protein